MTTVLRVELGFSTLNAESKGNYISTRQGPYSTYEPWMSNMNGYRYMNNTNYCEKRQPDPRSDGLKHRFGVIYGFKDIYQLFWWFEGDILYLNEAGFMISTYEVPHEDIEYGKRQIQFSPAEAKLLNMSNIRDAIKDVYFDDEFIEQIKKYF